ncbi:hypothetical protein [Streptomyces niger]|uniref:hypothetical protein n=1 Tax=Streptomyces niger TaxID=66373 RepID=UPI0018FEED79|nr:hypothetical protein [Streptomyces niger]
MSEGAFTLAGAVVGGLIGVVGTIGAARLTGRDQRRNQHEQWRREVRRDAYSAFITRATQALRIGTVAHESAQRSEAEVTSLIDDLETAAALAEEAASLVALEGPQEIGNLTTNISFRLDLWHRLLRVAYDGPVERRGESWDRARSASDEAEELLEQFTELCRSLLDG